MMTRRPRKKPTKQPAPVAGRPRSRPAPAGAGKGSTGAKILAARQRSGISQAAAAAGAGIGQSYWAEIESGHKQPPINTLLAIAVSLGCNPADLLPDKK